MNKYFSVLTAYGSKALANAIATNQPIQLDEFAVGDGNGKDITPTETATALVGEKYRTKINSVSVDAKNNKQIIVECIIPENVGGFTLRELGLFDHSKNLFAYANVPESYKPVLESGSGKTQILRMILLVSSSSAVTLTVDSNVALATKAQLTPKTIDQNTGNTLAQDGHTHEIAKASTTQAGIVQLSNEANSDDETKAPTLKALKGLSKNLEEVMGNLDFIPNSDKSNSVTSESSDTVGTSKAVKIAYDRAVEAEKNALPVGAVIAFPQSVTNPTGFLLADGSTFEKDAFPDLYKVLGNTNKLPNLTRSDIGALAYFPFDDIPDGWLACDGSVVNRTLYPELYSALGTKYGASGKLPNPENRFIRNAGNNLTVGQTQEDAIRNITGKFDTYFRPDLSHFTPPSGAFVKKKDINGKVKNGEDDKWSITVGFDASKVVPTADENRPKAIAFKLCIKAQNRFDDVKFWVKAFGNVIKQGLLDASKLAQDLQSKADKNHTHKTADITDFEANVKTLIAQAISKNFTYQEIGDFKVRKYPDGTMIQTWGKGFVDVGGASQIGKKQLQTFTWAVAFKTTPQIYATVATSMNSSSFCSVNILYSSNNAKVDFIPYEDWETNQQQCRYNFLAIGRWK